ncbi:MAG: dehydrogenase subunit [Ignavibacteria bacterium]|nr:dehydrogenase subunit [Ignavibacteria bacterium]
MLTDFGIILIFFIVGMVFVAAGLITNMILRPSHPNKVKQSTYECGEEAIGSPWILFNARFYLIALAFLIFEVELLLLFPWAVVFKELGWFAFIAMLIFAFILLLGLFYDWAKGYLDWDKPEPIIPKMKDLVIWNKD